MQLIKKTKLYIMLAYFYRCTRLYIIYIVSLLFRICPINKNKIVICSYLGSDYCDNPKYIIDNIIKQNTSNKYKIVWALRKKMIKNNVLPDNIKTVKYGSLLYLYELVTAKVWIDNTRKMFVPIKRRGQCYIQTWHGSMPLKMVEFDTKDTLSKIYVKCLKIDNRNADYFISGSKWTSNLYRTAFKYSGKIIEEGIPRNDIFFKKDLHNQIINKVYSFFNIPEDNKIILYAPTFRNNKSADVYYWNYNKVIKSLEKKYNKQFVLLIRLHPNVANNSKKMDCFNDIIMDATTYPDMQELLIASEILVTDYSSSMFDFGMIDKKCFLFAPDIKNYLKERNFYFDIKKLPFPLSESELELEENINKFDDKSYFENLKKFYDKIGIYETGKSSEIIAKKVMEACDND